ncbi:hypothetical protein JXR93_10110 [bacterium]|nr:hypothetical protein [bacterium]
MIGKIKEVFFWIAIIAVAFLIYWFMKKLIALIFFGIAVLIAYFLVKKVFKKKDTKDDSY